MASFRDLDNRKMRDRDATSGDRWSGGDLDTLTDGTSVPTGNSSTEGYGDQETGMGSGYSSGYSSGGQMAGSGETGGSADADDSGSRGDYAGDQMDSDAYSGGRGRGAGDPLPDSGGPDVTDMGENEPNAGYGHVDRGGGGSGQATDMGSGSGSGGGMMGSSSAGADSGTAGIGMGSGSGGSSATDMGSSTGSGGNWGDPGTSTDT